MLVPAGRAARMLAATLWQRVRIPLHRGLEDVAERVPARRPPAAPRKSESLFAVVEVPAADHAAGGPPPPPGATTTAPRGVTRSWGKFSFGMAWAERKGVVKSGALGGGTCWDAGRLRERYEV